MSQAANLPRPALSLILCSRNDQYQGNSLWRLQTALNYAGQQVRDLGREDDVEIIVSDWGSEIPLRDVIALKPEAARLVRFLTIPPEIGRIERKDSPFPEVLALNAAARRARGEYIGRIDQDTLVGRRFFETFFWLREKRRLLVPLNSAVMLSNRRGIPYRFAVHCPSLWIVDRYLRWFGRFLPLKSPPPVQNFYHCFVGIFLMHRDIWYECGGYDQRFIYMDGMEVDMTLRLSATHQAINLGELTDYAFYHLDHGHPRVSRSVNRDERKTNPPTGLDHMPKELHPNDADWGLHDRPLDILPPPPGQERREGSRLLWQARWPMFVAISLLSSFQVAVDAAPASLRKSLRRARKLLGQLGGRYVKRRLDRLRGSAVGRLARPQRISAKATTVRHRGDRR